MKLSNEQIATLRQLYLAKGDVLEAAMTERLINRGIDEESARSAARQCSRKILTNSLAFGGAAAIVLGSLFTPVVGGIAGGSLAGIVGWKTLLTSQSCETVRDFDLQLAVDNLNNGLH